MSLDVPFTKGQLYGRRWRRAKGIFLIQHPMCVMCMREGIRKKATVVDHIQKHEGNPVLFWDAKNWQALCSTHHDRHKQIEEKSGRIIGIDREGRPTHPLHPWNKKFP